MSDTTITSRELSLHEMLADPIVQTIMARDGVTRQQVEGLIEAVRDKLRLARGQSEIRGTDRHEVNRDAR